MNKENYRILSADASLLYMYQHENKKYKLDLNSDKAKSFFSNSFDFSLDKIYLDSILGKKDKPFKDGYGNLYLTIIINVTFDHVYRNKKTGEEANKNELRTYLYNNGFEFNGCHYSRYKRSCGSSREGTCLFIRDDYLERMQKWSDCGLSHNIDKSSIASWEAYRALSLSSIEDTIDIPLKGILVVPDEHSIFKTKAIVVKNEGKIASANMEEVEIDNNIWDGESLLDERLFASSENYKDRSMLLLRNKFFKSCGFRCSIQKFFKDHNINSVNDLNKDCIYFTDDINDIMLVTTPSSLKFLKFLGKIPTKENIEYWFNNSGKTFGIVKHDKKTAYFNGRMVETNYQLINTLHLNEEKAKDFLQESIDYAYSVWRVKDRITPLMYYLHEAYKRDVIETSEDVEKDLRIRSEILLEVMNINKDILNTNYFKQFKYDSTSAFKKNLRNGNILVRGTYATLFGNGPQLLMRLTKDYKKDHKKIKDNTIYCKKFNHKELIIGARSPHITMGNILIRYNDLENDFINAYFPNLTEEIVCVNAIGENIQQMLNGCDYDSDTILLTNNEIIKEAALKFENKFLVPVCKIEEDDSKKSSKNEIDLLVKLDHSSSNNNIGNIVNKSQILNSKLWDVYNNEGNIDDNIYNDICKLAVLSGVEIDSAKRSYKIETSDVLNKIKYKLNRPTFLQDIDKDRSYDDTKAKTYTKYDTAMSYIYEIPNKEINLSKKRKGKIPPTRLVDLFKINLNGHPAGTDYKKGDKILSVITDCRNIIDGYNKIANSKENRNDAGRLSIIYKDIRDEKNYAISQIKKLLIYNEKLNINALRHVLEVFEDLMSDDKNSLPFIGLDLLFNIDEVKKLLRYNRPDKELTEDPNGDISLYDFKFIETSRK